VNIFFNLREDSAVPRQTLLKKLMSGKGFQLPSLRKVCLRHKLTSILQDLTNLLNIKCWF